MENICFLFTRFNQYSHNFLQTIENQTRTLSYKNKVPSFFFGTIYFNKFSANAFLLVFFSQILMIVKRNFFFRIQRFDTNKRRNEESLHISKGKIIFVFTVFTFSMNLSEK
jgi:hypothetical protein